jgi:hypothetical protein
MYIYYYAFVFNYYSDIEEDVDSLKQFSTELVIEAAVRCLDVIQPGLGLPHSLPDSMSARFRVGASIAQACKVMCVLISGGICEVFASLLLIT